MATPPGRTLEPPGVLDAPTPPDDEGEGTGEGEGTDTAGGDSPPPPDGTRADSAEPRSLEDMVAHRFLYPPHAQLSYIDAAERRTTRQHLDRMAARGLVEERDGRWRRLAS